MSQPAIQLLEVSKHFGPRAAVSGLSLEIPEGACYGLIGPNGAGKTTTFSLLCGFLRPTDGQIRVLGRDVREAGALKGRVGVLPQDAQLPAGWKLGALLTYWARLSGVDAPERAAREVLEKVALSEAWGQDAGSLLLDEPTAGLDPKVAALVRQIVEEMRGKRTVLISSHNLEELERLCDGAAILDHGKLAQAGAMGELTGAAVEFRIEIVRGEVPLSQLLTLPGVQEAFLEPNGQLVVRHHPREPLAEDVIAEVVGRLLAEGVRFRGISRGQRLEARVLQIT